MHVDEPMHMDYRLTLDFPLNLALVPTTTRQALAEHFGQLASMTWRVECAEVRLFFWDEACLGSWKAFLAWHVVEVLQSDQMASAPHLWEWVPDPTFEGICELLNVPCAGGLP